MLHLSPLPLKRGRGEFRVRRSLTFHPFLGTEKKAAGIGPPMQDHAPF